MEIGERVEVTKLKGYKLVQNRPFDCRPICNCGDCDGITLKYPGTVEKIIHWADNSLEAIVLCDDGEKRGIMLKPPSGDLCF